MLKLVHIDLEEFKESIYPYYLELFPKSAFEIYNQLLGEERVKQNCKIIRDSYFK